MKKKFIVKNNYDFENIISQGSVKKNSSFVIYSLNNSLSYDKFGISVGKKIGNAVVRNRFKRKIRAIIDKYKKNYVKNADYIIILRRGAQEKSYQELENDFFNLMQSF